MFGANSETLTPAAPEEDGPAPIAAAVSATVTDEAGDARRLASSSFCTR